jgi:hypothetical protein
MLAPYRDGRCLVLQDFHRAAVCFQPNGQTCPAPDVSVLQDGYLLTIYSKVLTDASDRLVVAETVSRYPESGRPEDAGKHIVAKVTRLIGSTGGDGFDLFSTEPMDDGTIGLSTRGKFFVMGCWDVSPNGRLIYADIHGAYRVNIGHPSDGKSKVVELPVQASDDDGLRRYIKETGVDVELADVFRIRTVHWLDDERFAVQPSALSSMPADGIAGAWEIFDETGHSQGRFRVHVDLDHVDDLTFVCRDRLIVVKGGYAAVVASRRAGWPDNVPIPETSSDIDHLEVHVYELFGPASR